MNKSATGDGRTGGCWDGERQQTQGWTEDTQGRFLSVWNRQRWASVSISHLLSHSLRTPRPFHLLSHFYPSCNHRDHHCLKRGFSQTYEDARCTCPQSTQLNSTPSPPSDLFKELLSVEDTHCTFAQLRWITGCWYQSHYMLVITGF